MSSLDFNINDFMEWSVTAFEKATHLSSLEKLEDELKELKFEITDGGDEIDNDNKIIEEYVDVMMCLLHSAAKYGFTSEELRVAFQRELIINKMRKWNLNANNTYSHTRIKE